MSFGTSYSLVYVDCLDWVHTGLFKRVIRGILGALIATGIFFLFQLIPCNDNPTRFFFLYAMPALVIAFFVYGVFPIICLKLKLVYTFNESYEDEHSEELLSGSSGRKDNHKVKKISNDEEEIMSDDSMSDDEEDEEDAEHNNEGLAK